MITIVLFLSGAFAMACCTASLYFLRFWRDSKDRLFAWFTWAFALLAAERVLIDALKPHAVFFVIRLVAFLLIICAIIDKNRTAKAAE